jgi:tetratricopeptide (TPR) repeat protein
VTGDADTSGGPALIPSPNLEDAEAPVVELVANARSAVAQDLRSADAWGQLGMVLDAHGLDGDAVDCYREAARLEPGERRRHYLLAVVLATQDPPAALKPFEHALALAPSDVLIHQRYADALLRCGREQEARSHYRTALDLDPNCRLALLGLATLALGDGQLDLARTLLERAVAVQFYDRQVHVKLAQLYGKLGQPEQAHREVLFTRAFPDLASVRDPVLAEVAGKAVNSREYTRRGLAYVNARRYVQAERAFRKVLELREGTAQAYLNLGGALAGQERFDEALRELRHAASLEPDSATVHSSLAAVLADAGRLDEALEHARTALRLDSNNDSGHYNLGHIFQKQGREDEAIDTYRQALALNPVNVPAHKNLAALLQQRGQAAEALKHWQEAVAFGRAEPEARFNLAAHLSRYGRFGEAVEVLEGGLRTSPHDTRLMMAIATIRATCPDGRHRDGAQAVALARHLTDVQDSDHVPTLTLLAAALAEEGQFEAAVAAAERAQQLARSGKLTSAEQAIGSQLALYRAKRPYHQASAAPPKTPVSQAPSTPHHNDATSNTAVRQD